MNKAEKQGKLEKIAEYLHEMESMLQACFTFFLKT